MEEIYQFEKLSWQVATDTIYIHLVRPSAGETKIFPVYGESARVMMNELGKYFEYKVVSREDWEQMCQDLKKTSTVKEFTKDRITITFERTFDEHG